MLKPSEYMRDTTPELVRLMYTSRLSVLVIGLTLILVTSTVAVEQSDPASSAFACLTAVVTTVRIWIASVFERAYQANMTVAEAALWEWRYAAGGLPFALLVGMFSAYSLTMTDTTAQALSLVVALAYPAGMIVRVAVRPHVARMLLVVALVPPVIAAALVPTVERLVLSFILASYVAIGFELIRYLNATIVDRVRFQKELARLALHDELTGLANRRYFKEVLADTAGRGEEHAVLVVDLDRFKAVNDTHGHDVGDAVLREIGRRLVALADASDLVVRLGGDEFAVVRRGHAAKHAQDLADALVKAMCVPVATDAGTIAVGASVGISHSANASSWAAMLSKADSALYEAKRAGRGQFAVAR